MNFANVKTLAIPEGNVKQIEDAQGNVLWKKVVVDTKFRITNEDTQQITVSIKKTDTNAPTITLQISDDGNTWTSLGNTSTSALNITIPVGGKKYLRSTSANAWGDSNSRFNRFSSTGKFGARGSIMTLLGYNTLKGYDCRLMFNGCTGLTVAPELPATTLARNCYMGMFGGCTSLIESPELPATSLITECYSTMFWGCTSLNKITCNARYNVDPGSYWVNNVAASGTFYKNPSMYSWTTGPSGIPSGWTVQNIQ